MRPALARNATFARACCATLLLLTGCASNEMAESLKRSLAAAPDCCTGPREFRFDPTAVDQRVVFTIDARSAAYPFAHGKSYFKAFALPAAPRASAVTIVSFPEIGKTALNEWSGRYFSPIVTFYDAGFAPLRTTEGPTNFMLDSRGRRFSAFLAPVPPEARYLAVFTDARLLETTLPIPVEFVTQDTHAVACNIARQTLGPAADAELAAALCGLFAGYLIYAPPQTLTFYATIPYSAGGNLELWLSGPPAPKP